MINKKIKDQSLKDLYQSRKVFNQYVTNLLGKDAFLHEISQNSDSSQSSNDLSSLNMISFSNKSQKKLQKTGRFNQNFNEQLISKSALKNNSYQQHSNQQSSNDQNLHLYEYSFQTAKSRAQRQKDKRIHDYSHQIRSLVLQILGLNTKKVIKDDQIINLLEKFIKNQLPKCYQQKKSSDYSVIDKNLNSMKLASIRTQLQSLKATNKILITKLQYSQKKNNKSNSSPYCDQNDVKSSKINQFGDVELQLLKKIANIRKDEITRLQAQRRVKQVEMMKLDEINKKLKKIIVKANQLNNEFIYKFQQYFDNNDDKMGDCGSYNEYGMIDRQSKQQSRCRLQLSNSRFKIVRNRSVVRDPSQKRV